MGDTAMATIKLPDGSVVKGQSKASLHYLYKEIFLNNVYLKNGLTVKEGDCIFDVGANIGMFMRNIYYRCNNKARIYAFEPIPQTFKTLQANAALDTKYLHVYNLGIADRDQKVTFEFPPHLPLWSSAKLGFSQERLERWRTDIDEWGKKFPRPFRYFAKHLFLWHLNRSVKKIEHVECSLKPLSKIIKEENIASIDLLKIDVEGSEIEVLQGIAEMDWPIIRQVAMEIETSNNLKIAVDLLKRRGFAVETQNSEQSLGGAHSEVSYLWARRNGAH